MKAEFKSTFKISVLPSDMVFVEKIISEVKYTLNAKQKVLCFAYGSDIKGRKGADIPSVEITDGEVSVEFDALQEIRHEEVDFNIFQNFQPELYFALQNVNSENEHEDIRFFIAEMVYSSELISANKNIAGEGPTI